MAYIPESNSVVAFQSNPSSLLVGASIIGVVPVRPSPASVFVVNPVSTLSVTQGSTWIASVFGNMSVIGTVPVTQSTSPWVVNVPTPSYIAYQAAGSVLAVTGNFTSGNTSVQVLNPVSLLAVNPNPASVYVVNPVSTITVTTGNSSVQLLGGVAAIGSVAVLQGTNPWVVNVPTPSYIVYQAAGSVLAVSGSFSGGNSSVQVVGTMPPQSVSGVGLFNVNHTGNGSVIVLGSVTTLQGTNPWNVNVPTPSYVVYQAAGSVLAVSGSFSGGNSSVQLLGGVAVIGSVATLQGTTPWIATIQANSIAGTYQEDTAHTAGDRGVFTLGIRNDAVASLVSADLEYVGPTKDSAGRTLIKPFAPDESRFSFIGSVTSASVTLAVPSTVGKRTYITDFWVANSGTATTLFQFRENTTSVIGTTIVPAGGGSNSPGIAMPIRTSNQNLDLSFTGLTATSILYVTINGYQAP